MVAVAGATYLVVAIKPMPLSSLSSVIVLTVEIFMALEILADCQHSFSAYLRPNNLRLLGYSEHLGCTIVQHEHCHFG